MLLHARSAFLRRLLGVLCLAIGLAGEARADMVERYLDGLALCQLPHLTMEGWFAAAPSRFYTRDWTRAQVDRLAAAARTRPERVERRDSRRLQTILASSYQAAAAYQALARAMQAAGAASIDRVALFRRAEAAYRRRLEAGGFVPCAPFKWGNRHPDLVWQPFPRAAWTAIAALFEPGRLDWPPGEAEAEALASGTLNREELAELRALRIGLALFEHQFAMLREDRGGWIGNLQDQPLVCTDEATTMSFLIDRLQEAGLLTRFEQHSGRFAHRDPLGPLPFDHFAVMLKNRRTGDYWVADSWAEDGGVPPRIDRLALWLETRARPGFVSLGDPALDAALAREAVAHDRPALMRRLRARLARLAPALPPPAPSGRPELCPNGFHFCGPPEAGAWGPR